MNKNWGKITNGVIEYPDKPIVWNNILYGDDAPEEVYRAMGFKKIVRSVHPDEELPERMKWQKTPDQDEETIFYKWEQVQMSDDEYLVQCHTKLDKSDWVSSAYLEGRMTEDKWNEWKAKRKAWWEFVRSVES